MSPVILLLCVGAAVALPAPQFVQQPNTNLPAPLFVQQPNTNLLAPKFVQQPNTNLPAPLFVQQPNTNLLAPQFVQQPNTNQQIGVKSRQHYSDDSGQFVNNYESADNQVIHQTGRLVPNHQNDGFVLVIEGSYSYTAPNGVPVLVTYVADENGFHPTGDVIPKSVQPLPTTF